MRSLAPWTGMTSLKREMDRMLFPTVGDWAPSMDISETKDSLVAKVEAPGMDQKDIHIPLQENPLTIKGETSRALLRGLS